MIELIKSSPLWLDWEVQKKCRTLRAKRTRKAIAKIDSEMCVGYGRMPRVEERIYRPSRRVGIEEQNNCLPDHPYWNQY